MELPEVQKVYLLPPSYEMVFSFLDELGVSMPHFENFYSIPKGTLAKYKCGFSGIPKKFWWIFYEKPVPKYGTFRSFNKFSSSEKLILKIILPKQPKSQENQAGHGRIKTIK